MINSSQTSTAENTQEQSRPIPRNYILYGVSRYEGYIFKRFNEQNEGLKIIEVSSDLEAEECFKTIRYKPIFHKRWGVVAKLDTLSKEVYLSLIKLLVNADVACYFRLIKNSDLYTSIWKSKSLNALENLQVLNAKFPSLGYVRDVILDGIGRKKIEDYAIEYIYKQVRFNILELDKIVLSLKASDYDEIGKNEIKEIVPLSKTRSIKTFCYQILLNFREDLPARWKDKEVSFASSLSKKKKKPFEILDGIEMNPFYLLNEIIKQLKNIKYVRKCYFTGMFSENSIFDIKEELDKKDPVIKELSIPAIREYIFVSREVLLADVDYCLTEFQKLKSKRFITLDDIQGATMLVMNRRN